MMIVAEGLTKRYGRVMAVDGVSFMVPRGGVTGLLGPNGAGKSTTIRMMTGYLPPSSGVVRLDGLDVVRDNLAVRRRIGYLPESAPLHTEMRVSEYLHFRGKLFGMRRSDRRKAIDHVVRRCWLEEVRHRPIGQLSKGYRQRVGLAAALLHDPPVLILDEPTVGLDPAQIREVRDFVRELATSHTIVLSTHILPEVERTCDRIIMLAGGRVRVSGTLDELRNRASQRSPYVVETDVPAVEQWLRKLAGVRRVESERLDNRWLRLRVVIEPGAGDPREAIGREVTAAGGVVRHLALEAPSLEQLYVQLVSSPETIESSEDSGDAQSEQPSARPQRVITPRKVEENAA